MHLVRGLLKEYPNTTHTLSCSQAGRQPQVPRSLGVLFQTEVKRVFPGEKRFIGRKCRRQRWRLGERRQRGEAVGHNTCRQHIRAGGAARWASLSLVA